MGPPPGGEIWVEQYVTDAGSTPLLADEAVAELVRRAHRGDETAAESVVRAYRRLVVAVAKKYAGPMGELIPLGEAGLRTAVERFEPAKGYKFSTYASWHIRRAVTRGASGAGGGPGGEPGGAGDRHPRRPLPSSGAGSAALPLPVDVT